MAKKFLHIIFYCMCCLAISHGESKADCATYRLWPWNSPYIGPWFGMNYISCKDGEKKNYIRQGWGSLDPLVASDAQVGSHVIIGHLNTYEDWYSNEMVPSGGKDITCDNWWEGNAILGTPYSLHAKQKHPIEMDSKVKTPKEKGLTAKPTRGKTITKTAIP